MAPIQSNPLCRQADLLLKAGLSTEVLLPSDALYNIREESYWSNNAKIKPACIVRPRSAHDVSLILKSLVANHEKFAVRSGGHMPCAGFNNIADGVTIDLSLMNWTRYDKSTETVDLGPGGRWGQVYAELQTYDRMVAGGREGNVGVAGLLLGGGNTFLTARWGFACDNVVSYEVVLANGSILTADADHHYDLFKALKGGSNNFGVVTNFRMRTFPCDQIWGGLAFYPKAITSRAIEALVDFTDRIAEDMDSNLLCFITYLGKHDLSFKLCVLKIGLPDRQETVIAAAFAQMAGIGDAPTYQRWKEFPETTATYGTTSVSKLVSDFVQPTQHYNAWFTASFRNDARIAAKAAELHDELVEGLQALIPKGDFLTQCLFQPLPKVFGEHSGKTGGNMLGLERQQDNGLLWLAAVMVRTSDQEKSALPLVEVWVRGVQDFAASIPRGNQAWVYLNYAHSSQNPLASYGLANVCAMKEVAAKYDPTQVFQQLCPGGFKISQVHLEEEVEADHDEHI